MFALRALIATIAMAPVSCTGYLVDPAAESGPSGAAAGSGGTASGGSGSPPDAPLVAAPFRQLTRQEYERTVRDLLGDETPLASALAAESPTGTFTRNAFDRNVTESAVVAFKDVAHSIAERTVAERLDRLVACDPDDAAAQPSCGLGFIDTFAPRAFRRPLTAGARNALVRLFEDALSRYGFRTAIQLTLEAVLQSPYYLYHVEDVVQESTTSGLRRIDDHALAARLSYFLTGSLPDAALWAAAERGTLASQLGEHAARLLDGRAFTRVAWDFHREWLRTDDLRSVYKSPELVTGWPDEATRNRGWEQSLHDFVAFVFSQPTPRLTDLLTSEVVLLPDGLVELYAAATTTPRFGLLTQPALLAKLAQPDQSNPVKRGLFVLEKLLCSHVPPPPPEFVDMAQPPVLEPNMTTRERYAAHSTNPECAGCHVKGGIDALGFAFEHYDALGRYREIEVGRPIDASGSYAGFEDEALRGPYRNAGELVDRLVRSSEVRRCMTGLWYSYALGRTARAEDRALIDHIAAGWTEAGTDFRALALAIVESEAFRTRASEEQAP